MRVTRKGEVVTGKTEGQGVGTESVKGATPVPLGEGISPAKGQPFVERLFSNLLAEIRGTIDTLQTRVDETAAALVAQPNQVTLDTYKDAVSHFLAFLIDNSVTVEQAQSLKRGKDGKPKVFLRVQIVNEKLAELTRALLNSQKPLLDLVNRLDEIRGILVDFYDWKPGR